MKAISIQQPWAWLIVHGHKDIENRDWPTKVRGRVLIHAGKKIDPNGYDFLSRHFPHLYRAVPGPNAIEVGGIVGEAQITDCVRQSESPWFFGEYGFVLSNAKPRRFTPVRGQLGFFDVAPPREGETDGEA
ncbi:ASCH domain-containing protein [Gemmatimonas sp.]